ncbi:hypothetical protein D3C81_1119870 [compost metagenome]
MTPVAPVVDPVDVEVLLSPQAHPIGQVVDVEVPALGRAEVAVARVMLHHQPEPPRGEALQSQLVEDLIRLRILTLHLVVGVRRHAAHEPVPLHPVQVAEEGGAEVVVGLQGAAGAEVVLVAVVDVAGDDAADDTVVIRPERGLGEGAGDQGLGGGVLGREGEQRRTRLFIELMQITHHQARRRVQLGAGAQQRHEQPGGTIGLRRLLAILAGFRILVGRFCRIHGGRRQGHGEGQAGQQRGGRVTHVWDPHWVTRGTAVALGHPASQACSVFRLPAADIRHGRPGKGGKHIGKPGPQLPKDG